VWKLAHSPVVSKTFACPGNPGIAEIAACVAPEQGYLAVAESVGADLTIVGPEAPLAAGIVDEFQARGRRIFGPTRSAAQLEASKAFSKDFMGRAGIPTAQHVTVETYPAAKDALRRFGFPVVLKADGLAAGKGVIIARNELQADEAIRGMLSGELAGDSGKRIVIEEFLAGEEVSFIALTDGETILPLMPTQDHKAIFDGDQGPNTGGMGAYCDNRILSNAQTGQIIDTVMEPTVRTMRAEGNPFTGFLYAGLMMTERGAKVLEFNVRMGDPETQPLMHRVRSDFAEVLMAGACGELRGVRLEWAAEPSVCIVLAAAGYPGKVRLGDEISGIKQAEATGATVFHAGTKMDGGALRTSGGRVLGVTSSGEDLAAAIARSYEASSKIRFDGMQYRSDIGRKGLKRW
jgi:phosphoribosylamine--glycine ligase